MFCREIRKYQHFSAEKRTLSEAMYYMYERIPIQKLYARRGSRYAICLQRML